MNSLLSTILLRISIFMKLVSMRLLNSPFSRSENNTPPSKLKQAKLLDPILLWKLIKRKQINRELRQVFIANCQIKILKVWKNTFFNTWKNPSHRLKLFQNIPCYGKFMEKTLILHNQWKNSTNQSRRIVFTLTKSTEIYF